MNNSTLEVEKIRYFDIPNISNLLFHPRKSKPIENTVEKFQISFNVENGVMVTGIFHYSNKNSPTILFFHGNGEIANDYDDIGPIYNSMNINFCVVDFRGYGTSDGSPTCSSLFADSGVIFSNFKKFLKKRQLNGPIYIMGRSLGSSSAVYIAKLFKSHLKGLILESGYAHTYKLLNRIGIDTSNLDPNMEKYISNLSLIKGVKLPTLIIHGSNDKIIPLSDARDLYKSIKDDMKDILIIPHAGHNDLLYYGMNDYMDAIKEFVQKTLKQ